MGILIWQWLANAAASLVAGVLLVVLLVYFDRHRDHQGPSAQKLVACFLGGLSAYTLLVLVVGHFFLNYPISEDITASFGDNRIAWLFVGITADVLARVYCMFDVPRPIESKK